MLPFTLMCSMRTGSPRSPERFAPAPARRFRPLLCDHRLRRSGRCAEVRIRTRARRLPDEGPQRCRRASSALTRPRDALPRTRLATVRDRAPRAVGAVMRRGLSATVTRALGDIAASASSSSIAESEASCASVMTRHALPRQEVRGVEAVRGACERGWWRRRCPLVHVARARHRSHRGRSRRAARRVARESASGRTRACSAELRVRTSVVVRMPRRGDGAHEVHALLTIAASMSVVVRSPRGTPRAGARGSRCSLGDAEVAKRGAVRDRAAILRKESRVRVVERRPVTSGGDDRGLFCHVDHSKCSLRRSPSAATDAGISSGAKDRPLRPRRCEPAREKAPGCAGTQRQSGRRLARRDRCGARIGLLRGLRGKGFQGGRGGMHRPWLVGCRRSRRLTRDDGAGR